MKNFTEIEEKLFLRMAADISKDGFQVKAYMRNSTHPFAMQLNGGDEMAFDNHGEAISYMNGLAVAMVELTKCSKTQYVARHGEGFGKNHFTDLKFNTAEEAQAEIDRTGNGLKANGEPHVEYKEYWDGIAANMYITVQETTERRL